MKTLIVLTTVVLFAIGCNWANSECTSCSCEAGCCSSDSCSEAGCDCTCKK